MYKTDGITRHPDRDVQVEVEDVTASCEIYCYISKTLRLIFIFGFTFLDFRHVCTLHHEPNTLPWQVTDSQ